MDIVRSFNKPNDVHRPFIDQPGSNTHYNRTFIFNIRIVKKSTF